MFPYIFYTLAGITLFTALMVITSKNPVHSVLFLILTFFLISAQYVLMNAQFLAVVNLIVYAGAIMVLFLFVLMLLNLNADTEPQKSNGVKIAAAIAGGILLLVITAALKDATAAETFGAGNPNAGLVKDLGKLLFTKYVVPFEMSGILFLAAMVGAVLVGKQKVEGEKV